MPENPGRHRENMQETCNMLKAVFILQIRSTLNAFPCASKSDDTSSLIGMNNLWNKRVRLPGS